MTDSGELLMDACDAVIKDPSLAPEVEKKTGRILKTHCNRAALIVAQAMGCHEFDTPAGTDPLMADQMIAVMAGNFSGKWRVGNGSAAAIHALSGGLGFAAKTAEELGDAHGHICAVYPASQQRSNSWKRDVPMVANVGRDDREMKASEAFPVSKGEPVYYLWEQAA